MEPPGCRTCWECGAAGTEEHHIFYGSANRKQSERYGLKVRLCCQHHRGHMKGVHGLNKDLDRRLKEAGQQAFEETYSREAFVKIFGKNYLPEKEGEEMNRVILMGRLTRDPEVRYSQGENPMAVARYTLAVDRRGRRQQGNDQSADFINCVAFDKAGEFAERYFRQGMRVLVSGRIQTGSYTNRNGQRVYTTDIIVEEQEFADSKGIGSAPAAGEQDTLSPVGDGFMQIPEGLEDEGLPFN